MVLDLQLHAVITTKLRFSFLSVRAEPQLASQHHLWISHSGEHSFFLQFWHSLWAKPQVLWPLTELYPMVIMLLAYPTSLKYNLILVVLPQKTFTYFINVSLRVLQFELLNLTRLLRYNFLICWIYDFPLFTKQASCILMQIELLQHICWCHQKCCTGQICVT